jgi:hypothetical protein
MMQGQKNIKPLVRNFKIRPNYCWLYWMHMRVYYYSYYYWIIKCNWSHFQSTFKGIKFISINFIWPAMFHSECSVWYNLKIFSFIWLTQTRLQFSSIRQTINTNVTSPTFCVIQNFSMWKRLALVEVVDVSDDIVSSTFVLLTDVVTVYYSLQSYRNDRRKSHYNISSLRSVDAIRDSSNLHMSRLMLAYYTGVCTFAYLVCGVMWQCFSLLSVERLKCCGM